MGCLKFFTSWIILCKWVYEFQKLFEMKHKSSICDFLEKCGAFWLNLHGKNAPGGYLGDRACPYRNDIG
jgi:hypothetical protein